MHHWISAARPATLWAALAPVLVGTACAYGEGCLRLGPALAALFGALWIQIGTNFANDFFDHRKGADTEERLGPKRALQAGHLSSRQMAWATGLAFGLATLAGVYLVAVAGPWVAAIGVAAVLSGLAYTGGPFPLGYHALGDLFVFVFFGLVAVLGTIYVQCQTLPRSGWWAAVAMGSLSTAILVVNNLRDRHTDRQAGKRTLAVVLGGKATRVEYTLLVLAAFSVPVLAAAEGASAILLIPLIALPWGLKLIRRVATTDGAALNQALKGTARLLLLFSLLYAVSLGLVAG